MLNRCKKYESTSLSSNGGSSKMCLDAATDTDGKKAEKVSPCETPNPACGWRRVALSALISSHFIPSRELNLTGFSAFLWLRLMPGRWICSPENSVWSCRWCFWWSMMGNWLFAILFSTTTASKVYSLPPLTEPVFFFTWSSWPMSLAEVHAVYNQYTVIAWVFL